MPMKDGFRTLIGFNNLGGFNGPTFAEVTVKPPGMIGRGPIDTTSMRNVALVTKWPKQLVDFSNLTSSVQWDPVFWTQIFNSVLLKNQWIMVKFPNLQTLGFYGWADSFEPNDHREGEVPLSNLTVILSNVNPQNVETTPTLTG